MSQANRALRACARSQPCEDIRILLLWAQEANDIREKIGHTEQALAYLGDVVETLRELRKA